MDNPHSTTEKAGEDVNQEVKQKQPESGNMETRKYGSEQVRYKC